MLARSEIQKPNLAQIVAIVRHRSTYLQEALLRRWYVAKKGPACRLWRNMASIMKAILAFGNNDTIAVSQGKIHMLFIFQHFVWLSCYDQIAQVVLDVCFWNGGMAFIS